MSHLNLDFAKSKHSVEKWEVRSEANVSSHQHHSAAVSAPQPQSLTLKHLRSVRSGHAAFLTSVLNDCRRYIDTCRSKSTLEKSRDKIQGALRGLDSADEQFRRALVLDNDIQEAVAWFGERKSKAVLILSELDVLINKDKSVSFSKTQSSKSTRVSKSVTKGKLLLQAEQAKLRASHFKQAAELVEKAAEIEAARAKQVARQDVEMAELEAKVLENIANSDNQESDIDHKLSIKETDELNYVRQWVDDYNRHEFTVEAPRLVEDDEYQLMPNPYAEALPTHIQLNPLAPPFVTSQIDDAIDAWIDKLIPGQETVIELPNLQSVSDQLAQVLVKVESERELPKVELPNFTGAAIEWPRFVEQFYIQVHCRPGLSDVRRMDLLQSHLSGEALSLVRGLGYSGRNYALALQELKDSFGHRVKVARAYLEKVTSGPVIPSHDASALRKFYVSIRDCITTLCQLKYSSDLQSSETLLKAARRLPFDKISKWNEYIKSISKKKEPSLHDLQQWLKDRVDADYNPYAIHRGIAESSRHSKPFISRPNPEKREKQSTLFAATTRSTGDMKYAFSTDSKPLKPREKQPCPLCSEPHYLYRCALFSNKTVKDRHFVIKEHNLCFNCLKRGHSASKCLSIRRCQEPGGLFSK